MKKTVSFGNSELDLLHLAVSGERGVAFLTALEVRLLATLVEHPHGWMQLESMVPLVWGHSYHDGCDEAITSLLKRARRKLKAVGSDAQIVVRHSAICLVTPSRPGGQD
jgi:DNA-binding response OmpR family regulator